MFKRDWTTTSSMFDCSTLNNEHKWEALCICSLEQQICTSNDDNQIKHGPIFNSICVDASL